jgi:ethanolamine-phosphate phospho-lyase
MDHHLEAVASEPADPLLPPPKPDHLMKTDSFASSDTAVVDLVDAAAAEPAAAAAALALRRAYFAPNATLSHSDAPLCLSRGAGCRLYCASTGRAYLDAQNNVAHVGHAHRAVAEAVARQLLEINTNARYASLELGAYCAELVATLPAEVRGCFPGGRGGGDQPPMVFLTNSGSEANDLALRLARARHHQRFPGGGAAPAFHVAVLAGAYHGHLDSVSQLSPYKFWASSGGGDDDGRSEDDGALRFARTKPEWVHVVPVPLEKAEGSSAGAMLFDGAAAARAVARAARLKGGRIGLVIAEPAPSCAGQVALPPGFLASLFATLRAEEGALCCVDEVQTGFGRFGGGAFWAFEEQLILLPPPPPSSSSSNCLPDLVTMGKPMGNGYPLAGLIATRAAAQAFVHGAREPYFNTFGGSNASVAAGRAVLRAIRDDRLVERAGRAGAVLGAALARVAAAHPEHVRDVRGQGLFWGVEVSRWAAAAAAVADEYDDHGEEEEEEKEEEGNAACCWLPAPAKAAWVARRMRDASAVLVSVDGVYGNVLKIKPPMCFGAAEARELAAALDAALAALPAVAGEAGEGAARLERRERELWRTAVRPVRATYERNARELGLM